MPNPSDLYLKKKLAVHLNAMETVKTVIRRSHVKSRNGCQTCKRKRVKCDEFWPICRRCVFTGSECEYYRSPITLYLS
ncbi:hypothetical protein V8C40DRAFT_258467 [Trichoderma camerunense]